MNSRPPQPQLLPWVLASLGLEYGPALVPVAGDASARRYFRLVAGADSYIAVEAPPASEKNKEFLAIRDVLEAAGLCVPALLAVDLQRGFLLLSDLGDRLLLNELKPDTVHGAYGNAMHVLQQLAFAGGCDANWPRYDEALLNEELGRFPDWFVDRLLSVDAPAETTWQPLVDLLTGNALEQPRVLVHRDYHSRNLMPQADGRLAVIDFQDAVIGPVTYDLVSLLRDCYVRWEPSQVRAWALAYLAQLQRTGALENVSEAAFLRWFDLMGLQRHLRVLGTFARLYLRDGKPGYLADLPLVLRYVRETLHQYQHESAAIGAFAEWFRDELSPAVAAQPWSNGS